MAGKSTFLRQNALLAILAQAGSLRAGRRRCGWAWSTACSAASGAGDDLARGRSTFMAEMVETAAILTQATPRSFVILDEIGRGTATYDGLAIAWACAEALHDANRCRALFATHYHELAAPGGAAGPRRQPVAEGQGVERRPGLPARGRARPRRPLLRRAGGQAGRRAARRGRPGPPGAGPAGERGGVARRPGRAAAVRRRRAAAAPPSPGPAPVEAALAALDLDGMSPREAMDALYRLKG